ncbi:Uncharacterised protein [Providencia rustigianii]|uniref:Uncharacterized protein n=4 Tax=Morganellaceae TaxID=1903414 RepID=D1P557_9GAMM|nr:hypothetical protein PROVRUST_07362 [Providencia rustigianii DSM 4541]MTC57709.1 hypothetical protein [Providencia rustigianii]SPY77805.1 Uncharacterised protein [Providencia rustigianii]SUC27328.1 Uncharacterised protein [Providencia rustigianii]SUC35792.1 Uncharacterised protein [Providencia rustigianii]
MLLRSLILLLVAGCAYIAGLMTDLSSSAKVNTESKVKNVVKDFLDYPEAATYKNFEYHMLTKNSRGDETGYYCGEVFGFEDELSNSYRRFIVRVYQNVEGNTSISIPLIEQIDDIIPPEQFTAIWERYCEDRKL